jgi:hypothetical protein
MPPPGQDRPASPGKKRKVRQDPPGESTAPITAEYRKFLYFSDS